MPVPPTIIDYGTEDDAGFWKDALRFAPFRIEDFRAQPRNPTPRKS